MQQLTHIAIIYNPNSTGSSKENAEELIDALRERDVSVPVEMLATEYAGHASELAFALAQEHERPLIVSSSGDGGYNEVINGALRAQSQGAKPVCAVLPSGNANDHSRTTARHSLPGAIANELIDHIDVLEARVNGQHDEVVRYAHSYIGVGLTPAIAVELNRTSLNRLKESFIVIKSFRDFHPVEVEINGQTKVIDSMIFANISQMAKVLTIARNAKPDDGEFKIVTLPYRRKHQLLFALAKAAIVGLKGVGAKSYQFSALKDMAMQFDGEVLEVSGGDVVDIVIKAKALSTVR